MCTYRDSAFVEAGLGFFEGNGEVLSVVHFEGYLVSPVNINKQKYKFNDTERVKAGKSTEIG